MMGNQKRIKEMVEAGDLKRVGEDFYEDLGGHVIHESQIEFGPQIKYVGPNELFTTDLVDAKRYSDDEIDRSLRMIREQGINVDRLEDPSTGLWLIIKSGGAK